MKIAEEPEEFDHTVVVDRGTDGDDEPDHTVVVDRGTDGDDEPDHTVVVDRGTDGDDEPDHTVVVDRGTDADDESDATVMVTRVAARGEAQDDDHTVMVEGRRSSSAADADDHTVAVTRVGDADADHTVAVRGRKARGAAATEQTPGKSRRGKRRGIAPPPVPIDFAPAAIEAAGPLATEVYRPRSIPPPPVLNPDIVEGAAATRVIGASIPSVARHSRSSARAAMVMFGLTCLVSVLGLAALVWWLWF